MLELDSFYPYKLWGKIVKANRFCDPSILVQDGGDHAGKLQVDLCSEVITHDLTCLTDHQNIFINRKARIL